MELLVAGFIIYVLGQLITISFISAVLWAVFVTGSAAGWGWTWLFFFLTYGGIAIVGGLVANDAFHMIGNSIARFFKRILR